MNAQRHPYTPADVVPPGETLVEWLHREDMNQVEFARRSSLTPKHITQVVKGKVGISPEVALAFERVTSIPARYWLQLEANYRTHRQRSEDQARLRAHVDILKPFPVRDLIRRGCISEQPNEIDTLIAVLRFFGVADPEALETVWLRPALYRRAKAFEADAGALACWLRLAEVQATRAKTAPYNEEAVREALQRIRTLSRLPGTDWYEPLVELCSSVGIALVVVKEFPRSRVNGATKWLTTEKAMVALSLRYRRNDTFWFTLFHELGHLLKHSRKMTFIDDGRAAAGDLLEEEADAFASRTLIPPRAAAQLKNIKSASELRRFAEAIGVADGIVVGRMRHEGLIPHSQWAGMIVSYRFDDDP